MLETLGTVLLLGMMAAFAVFAVMLNEGDHARRRRRRGQGPVEPAAHAAIPAAERADAEDPPTGDRRLPVGDFLFGALCLHGSEPLAFSQLADAAAGSGMSVSQVLTWIERAEAGGLIERVMDDAPAPRPAVRLTEAGMELARNNRRSDARTPGPDSPGAARAHHS